MTIVMMALRSDKPLTELDFNAANTMVLFTWTDNRANSEITKKTPNVNVNAGEQGIST